MILIQDGSQGPNVDKPLRIIGEPYKIQVLLYSGVTDSTCSLVLLHLPLAVTHRCVYMPGDRVAHITPPLVHSKPGSWSRRFCGRGTTLALGTGTSTAPAWGAGAAWT